MSSEAFDPSRLWFTEMHGGHTGLIARVDGVVETAVSDVQRIEVLETPGFGKALALYGSLMAAEGDYDAYNEMLAHVPLFVHPRPAEVLIVGGGDCGCLSCALEHPEVARLTLCEIDPEVVAAARRHFPRLTRGLADPRARLTFEDGKRFLEATAERFDVILLDLSDPVGPAAELFDPPFFATIADRLGDDGILCAQAQSPFNNPAVVSRLFADLRRVFPVVEGYLCHMAIYPASIWAFAFCSKRYHPIRDFDRDRYRRQAAAMDRLYYNDEVHLGAFGLPEYVRRLVGGGAG